MKKSMLILGETLLVSIASRVNASPLSPSKMTRIAKEFLFVLKYALSLAIFACVSFFVILAITDILSSISTIGGTEILSFSPPTLNYESPRSIFYILWIVGIMGFFIGWAIGWQKLEDKNLYRICKKVYRK